MSCYSYSELSFETFADWIRTFNKTYNIAVKDTELKEFQRRALRLVIEEVSLPLNDNIINLEQLSKVKIEIQASHEKYLGDMKAISDKKDNLDSYYKQQSIEFQKVEGKLYCCFK